MPTFRSRIRKSLSQQGIQVVLLFLLYVLTADSLPLQVHQGLYSVSLCIQNLLMWMLPVILLFFIAHTICSFQKQAPLFILSLIVFETLSNLASVWYAYCGGHIVGDSLPALSYSHSASPFIPLWDPSLYRPAWWSSEKGVLLGLLLGCGAAFYRQPFLTHFISKGKESAQWILTTLFSSLIPLFVLGFVAKMYKTAMLQEVFSQYSILLLWLVLFLACYILFLFCMGNNWSLKKGLLDFKNIAPAGGLAFTSGSSLASMPWTISCTAKNLHNPEFAKAIIPATTNIQQIGDCITNSFLCFVLYFHFFGHAPEFIMWASFSIVYVLARFATSAVLGGAIFFMLPIYESYLNFTPEMLSLILAFNVLLDPLVTSCNVLANGALCRIFEKVWMKVQIHITSKQSS